jgi:alpha-beta hydrolase superfamily lysophospholipase
MGGAVAAVALARNPDLPVAGTVLVAPAVWGRATQPWYQEAALWVALQLFPGWTPTGEDLGRQASDNIEMLRALGRDPLFIKETRIDAVAGLVDLMDEALASAPGLDGPLLLLYGAKDEIVPPEPILTFWSALPADAPDQDFAYYAEGWHMLLRDLQGDVVIDDVARWINDKQAPLPSGAEAAGAAFLEAEIDGEEPAS